MDLIHIHEVLQVLIEQDYTLGQLKEKFGKDSRFTTCGDLKLSFDEAIDFMQDREKIILKNDIISFNKEIGMCSHK